MGKKEPVNIKQIQGLTTYKGTDYLYALGEDGKMYLMKRRLSSNETTWEVIPTPNYV